jgi:hypothetical protein
MTAPAKADTPGQDRGVFAVDEDAALAELELEWAGGGYHDFSTRRRYLVGGQQCRGGAHRRHPRRAGRQDPGTLEGQAMRRISQ